MGLIAEHPDVHAIVYLGLGIQSNQARMMRDGRFYPDHGLERIVAYHERQDARFAEAADELSRATGKPILTATELAVADPDNAGPGGRAGQRAALLPERQPGRHRARPPVPRRPATGAVGRGDRAVVTRVAAGGRPDRRARRRWRSSRRRCCSWLWRWAAERRRPTAPPPPIDRRPAGAVAALTTPLLSFRRAPGVLAARRQPAGRSRPRSPSSRADAGRTVVRGGRRRRHPGRRRRGPTRR